MARKSLSKKNRFEVFKRDGFTCQYCGRMAPDVVLEVDHIDPVANGGDNGIINLVTSCFDCNRGKGKRTLTDKESIKKQQDQLKELNEKREQLEMMLEWRNELLRFEDEQIDAITDLFEEKTGASVTDAGRESLKRWIKEFGLVEILDCTDVSISQYYRGDDTIEKVFVSIPKIAGNRRRQKANPHLSRHHYIKGILRNRGMLYNENKLYAFLTKFATTEEACDELELAAKTCGNWTDFWNIANDIHGGDS